MVEREMPEEELSTYKDRLEGAMEAGNLAWWEMELPSGKVKFNDRKAEILGYSPEEFNHYTDFTDLLHPEDHERAMKAMQDHLEGKKDRYKVEYRIKTKDEGYKWFRDVGRITEQQGEYKKITGIVINIDQRKKAQKEKEESHRQLKTMFSNLPGMAYRALNDKDWTMKFVSDGCEELTGYKSNELTDNKGISYNELIAPEDKERVWEEVQKSLHQKEPYQVSYRIKTKNGEEKWVWEQGEGVFEDDEVKFLEGIIQDITKRKIEEKRKEEALKDKKRIMDTVPDIIYQLDKEGQLVEWNEEFVNVSGYSPRELKHKSALDFFPDEQRDKISKSIERAYEEGYILVESDFLTKSGETIPYSFTAKSIKDEEGKPVGLTGVGRDISERKEAEKELKRSEERKEFLNTLLRQDLGSKYQTIQGYLQLIEEDIDLPEEHSEYLRKAIKAGREVDEILGLAKKLEEIEGTELEGKKDPVKVLNQVIHDIKGFMGSVGSEIEKNYTESDSKVIGDYSLNLIFSQILLTRTQTCNCNKFRIKVREKEKEILVCVEDNGESLPINLKKMFSGESYTGETTGVGGVRYYMIKQISKHNKAEIDVSDSELGGARFDIYLKKA